MRNSTFYLLTSRYVIGLLSHEIQKSEMHDYLNLQLDSDGEMDPDSDPDYQSADEATQRKPLDYDIDAMFEVIKKRDDHHWSLAHIHNRWKKISDDAYGRTQLSRFFLLNQNDCQMKFTSNLTHFGKPDL